VFGLCKLVDLIGFAKSFRAYDLIASKFTSFSYLYPFIEILLGAMYLLGYIYLWQLIISLALSGLGIVSTMRILQNKQDVKCVCLGTKFDLTFTKITLAENVLMFLMTLFMFTM
jgi:prepilin signal peptidase PulO-like enzyme (type II secretory pathway)